MPNLVTEESIISINVSGTKGQSSIKNRSVVLSGGFNGNASITYNKDDRSSINDYNLIKSLKITISGSKDKYILTSPIIIDLIGNSTNIKVSENKSFSSIILDNITGNGSGIATDPSNGESINIIASVSISDSVQKYVSEV